MSSLMGALRLGVCHPSRIGKTGGLMGLNETHDKADIRSNNESTICRYTTYIRYMKDKIISKNTCQEINNLMG